MKREVIQGFLTMPGIASVALTTRRMRPVFYGLDQTLEPGQQLVLGQGILQLLDSISEGFDAFEFYFVNHTVFIYKQTSGLVLLVLTTKELELKLYRSVVQNFRQYIDKDLYSTISLFKQISGSTSQPSKHISAAAVQSVSRQLVTLATTASKPTTFPDLTLIKDLALIKDLSITKDPELAQISLRIWLGHMNQISVYASQYLGKMIAANYWKSTRPPGWLQEFSIDRSGQISHPNPDLKCDRVQTEALKNWASAYVQQCKQVIRNFDEMLHHNYSEPQLHEFIKSLTT
jgi:hypothetical protein